MSWSDSFRSNEERKRDELRDLIASLEKRKREAEETVADPAFVRYGSAQDAIRIKADHAKAVKEIRAAKKKLSDLEGNGK